LVPTERVVIGELHARKRLATFERRFVHRLIAGQGPIQPQPFDPGVGRDRLAVSAVVALLVEGQAAQVPGMIYIPIISGVILPPIRAVASHLAADLKGSAVTRA